MPYIKGKLKGQLTAPELRRMIKEHNKLMSITIPPKTDRDGLIKLINDNGYKVNHEKQRLMINKVVRKPNIKLPPAPTPKTTEQKAQAKKQKDKKKIEDNLKLKMKVEKVKSKTTSASTSTQTETPMQESKPKSKPKPKAEPIDEEKWNEFLDLVEYNKNILLTKRRPDDKRNKNQYDYYIFKYKNRKKEKENPKRMIRLVNNKIK